MTLFINGRVLTQPISGVQRSAREVLGALDALLVASSDLRSAVGLVQVVLPKACPLPNWAVLRPKIARGGQGHLWEQTTLYDVSREGVLLSLANSGPLRHRAHVLVLHDAHIYQIPSAFTWRYRRWHRMLRPRLARRAAALVTVSRASAAALSAHLGIPRSRFHIMPNAADHVLDWPSDPAAPLRHGLVGGGYLLAVGNHSPNKNLTALIAAHRFCAEVVPPLALVGGAVPGLNPTHAAGGRIQALGRAPDADLRGLYEGAAGFVFPSLHEGFGLPPLEAMQLGVPVISSTAGALPDVLGDAPIWFDPGNPSSIARALRRMAAERREMRARGLTQAARFSWTQSAHALLGAVGPFLKPDVDRGLWAQHRRAANDETPPSAA